MESVWSRLLERLTWTTEPTAVLHGRHLLLLLYVGQQDGGALDEILAQLCPDLAQKILAVDIRRQSETPTNDILNDGFYSTLCCCAAVEGRWNCPNCRTWSIFRWLPKPGARRPVRGRDPSQTWGLESITHQLNNWTHIEIAFGMQQGTGGKQVFLEKTMHHPCTPGGGHRPTCTVLCPGSPTLHQRG